MRPRRTKLSPLVDLAAVLAVCALVLERFRSGIMTANDARVGHLAQVLLRGTGAGPPPGGSRVVSFLGLDLPLAYRSYVGPWACWTAAPFVAAVPDPIAALSLHCLCWTVLSVAAAWWMILVVSGDRAGAFLGGLAMALTPAVVNASRIGIVYGGSPVVAFTCAALALLALACRGSRRAWLASSLAAGLAAGFAPQGLGTAAGWLACCWWSRRSLIPLLGRRDLAAALALLCVGCAPLAAANLLDPEGLSRAAHDPAVTRYGVDNTRFLDNLGVRVRQWGLLWGNGWGGISLVPRGLWHAALAACAGIMAWRLRLGPGGATQAVRMGALPLVCGAAIFILSAFTLGNLRINHLQMLLPLAFGVIVAAPGACPAALERRALAGVRVLLAVWALTSAVLPVLAAGRVAGAGLRVPDIQRRSAPLSYPAESGRDALRAWRRVLDEHPPAVAVTGRYLHAAFAYFASGTSSPQRPRIVPLACGETGRRDREAALAGLSSGDMVVSWELEGCGRDQAPPVPDRKAAPRRPLRLEERMALTGAAASLSLYRLD